ncbi:MAG: hypothetical protein AAGC60_04575 [Acidobacteriota bacterium]
MPRIDRTPPHPLLALPVDLSWVCPLRRVVSLRLVVPLLFVGPLPFLGALGPATAQVAPTHPPLRILIVSDEVNPHGRPDDNLTQPGELSAALGTATGLWLEGAGAVIEIATDQIENATALLALPRDDSDSYDVLVYFAHRIPSGPDATARQEAFVTAVDDFLVAGAGVVSFHHGIYRTAGKESMQEILGGEATGAVPWNTVDGQNVIDVAPSHPITTFGVTAVSTRPDADAAQGIPPGDYAFFNNTPDERYPSLKILPGAGTIEPLFASDYDQGGSSTHLLGYLHRRAA